MTLVHRIPHVRRPAAAAPAPFGSLLGDSLALLVRALTNRHAVARLDEMPDYLLKDVGLTRGDVAAALSSDWRTDPSLELTLAASRRRRRIDG